MSASDDASSFEGPGLRQMVAAGAVDDHRARIWMRSPDEGAHPVVLRAFGRPDTLWRGEMTPHPDADGTCAITIGNGEHIIQPSTDYDVAVMRPGSDEPIGECRFRSAPSRLGETPSRLAFGLMSCHQPFDASGRIDERATELIDLTGEIFAKEDVSRLMMVGDQVYTDLPEGRSLFEPDHFARVAPRGRPTLLDCDRREVRRLLHQRYRVFWSLPAMRAVQSGWASDLILDDHEIVDNFGSGPEHATPKYRALKHGALDAYYDYQASRSLRSHQGTRPASFHRCWVHGSVAAFLMDLRSERVREGDQVSVYSSAQLRALARFLEQTRSCHVLFLGLSVPLLHVPDWLADVGVALGGEASDAADRWSHTAAHGSRDRLLRLLRDHQKDNPQRRIVLLGGDIHVGLASRILWSESLANGGDGGMFQVISSAITNRYSPLMQRLASLAPKTRALIGRTGDAIAYGELLDGMENASLNPCGRLNVAIVEVWRHNEHFSKVRFKLYSPVDGRPEVVFDSGLL